MIIKYEDSLSKVMVSSILKRFDMAFVEPLHAYIDLMSYGDKLSANAHFILAYDGKLIGFVAYYINKDGQFAYIPLIAVLPEGRHRGLGHLMLSYLWAKLPIEINQVRLEVRESNVHAFFFYMREGFHVLSKSCEGKSLLIRNLR